MLHTLHAALFDPVSTYPGTHEEHAASVLSTFCLHCASAVVTHAPALSTAGILHSVHALLASYV